MKQTAKRVTSYRGRAGDVRTHIDIGATRYGSRKTNKRLLAALLACAFAVMVAIAVAATAHGAPMKQGMKQGIVSPVPWCMVSAPVAPAQTQLECISPRAFIPIVEVTK